jgi:hypothetical protein
MKCAVTPYESILGEAFNRLHSNVRTAHVAPLTADGVFDVVHGTHWATHVLVALMKLPAAGTRVPVALSVDVSECLLYERASLRLLFLRVPRVLCPRVRACVSPEPQGWPVDVTVEWRGHLICRYRGTMQPSQATS